MQIRLNKTLQLSPILSKTFMICLCLGMMVFYFSSCDRENPCDNSLCENGECVLSVDSVATVEGVTIQTSDTLTTSFRILSQEGTVIHQNDTFPLVSSLLIASDVEVSKTSNIPNTTSVFSLLTFPACDCFTGWDGVRCDEPAPCDAVNCLNGGVAVEIDDETCECDCPLGFTGNLCETSAPCDLVTCFNNSSCIVNAAGEGECVCDTGYEFPCIEETRQKFIGDDYSVILDSCSTVRETIFNVPDSADPYAIIVEKNPDNIEQVIFNSTQSFGAIKGTVTTDNEVMIQDTTDQMDVVETLSGTFDRDSETIDLLLKITYANEAVDTCRLVMTRE